MTPYAWSQRPRQGFSVSSSRPGPGCCVARFRCLATRSGDATALLLKAAERLQEVDPELARETYLEAMTAAIFAGPLAGPGASPERGSRSCECCAASARQPRGPDLLLDGLVALLSETYGAAVPLLRQAQGAIEGETSQTEQLRWMWGATVSTLHLWDDEGWERLSDLHLQLVRETGALGDLAVALDHRGQMHVFAGELALAASLQEALQEATELTGSPLAPYHAVGLVAMRGREAETRQFIDTARAEVIRRGEGAGLSFMDWAESVLYNGLGRYAEALAAARRVVDHTELVPVNWAMPELDRGSRTSWSPRARRRDRSAPDGQEQGERDGLGPGDRRSITRIASG